MARMYKEARGTGKDKSEGNPVESKFMGPASIKYEVSTDSQKSDLGKMRYYSSGNRGYPPQAIQGDNNY